MLVCKPESEQTFETFAAFELLCFVSAGNLLRVAADIRLPESRAMEVDTVHQGPSAGVHRLLGQAHNRRPKASRQHPNILDVAELAARAMLHAWLQPCKLARCTTLLDSYEMCQAFTWLACISLHSISLFLHNLLWISHPARGTLCLQVHITHGAGLSAGVNRIFNVRSSDAYH